MKYTEEVKDLFTVSDEYYLAHCISADFGMGAGIAVEFINRFNMKEKLKSQFPQYVTYYHVSNIKGDCLLVDRTFNLITKERVYQKPTYKSITNALLEMKKICLEKNITKIAMPLIGCGIDKLEWDRVSSIILDVFNETDIEILVCKIE